MDLVDPKKHHIFASSHPSPLGAYRTMGNYHSFNGSKIFSKINNKLEELGKNQINWKLVDIENITTNIKNLKI